MFSVRAVISAAIILPSILTTLAMLSPVLLQGQSPVISPLRSVSSKSITIPDTTGISFTQITSTFDPYFHFEPTSPSEGLPRCRATARGDHHAAMMFVTGSKNDIHDAQLFVGISQDSGEVAKNGTSMAVQFAKNAMPEWSGAGKWIAKNGEYLLKQARHHVSSPSTSIVRDNKRLVLALLVKPGYLAIDVQHK